MGLELQNAKKEKFTIQLLVDSSNNNRVLLRGDY